MKYLINLTIIIFLSSFVNAQTTQFDKLELYYAQKNYKNVYKLSGKLLDKPEFDDSKVPTLYRIMSFFRLSENKQWFNKKITMLDEIELLCLNLINNKDGQKVIDDHISELSALKTNIDSRIKLFQKNKENHLADKLTTSTSRLFIYIEKLKENEIVKNENYESDVKNKNISKNRDELIKFAKQQIGKPYLYAGTTPSGFDCSGFTSYVFATFNISLPRKSEDQYEKAKLIKKNDVQKGDLIFFDSGNGINHVGLIVSEKGKPLEMIHASTSKGIIITDIESSEYWFKKIKGYGTFLEQ